MISTDNLLNIGQFNKPHGLKGEIAFTLTQADLFDAVDPDYLVVVVDGIAVPFFITDYRFRNENSGLMMLEGISSDSAARGLTNFDIFLERKQVGDNECETPGDSLVGYTLIDQHLGLIGEIIDIDQSTINTLLLVKHKRDDIYVPYAEEYFTDMDPDARVLHCNLPDGLIE